MISSATPETAQEPARLRSTSVDGSVGSTGAVGADGATGTAVSAAAAGSSHTDAMVRIGHALSDSTRSHILLSLRNGSMCPSDIVAHVGATKQSVSNHLACLRGCGLVVGHKSGRHMHYELASPEVAHALGDLLALARLLDPDCCSGATCSCGTHS